MNTTQEEIKNVLERMLAACAKQNSAAYDAVRQNDIIVQAMGAAKKGDYDKLYFTLFYPLEQVIDGLLAAVTDSREARFIFKNSQFVEAHFQNIIEGREGSACSADKSGTIMRGLLRFYMTGEEIQFDHDQQYTFHLPKTVFTTHDAIIAFFNGVQGLYYGKSAAYLTVMMSIFRPDAGAETGIKERSGV